MKKERVRSKHGFGGIAKFLLGCLTGFIIALLTVGGIGFWAYNSLTVRKVEKLIKSDITSNSAVIRDLSSSHKFVVSGTSNKEDNNFLGILLS